MIKTYEELSAVQKAFVLNRRMGEIITAILEGVPLLPDDLESNLKQAIARSESMHTPWFAGEYLMDDPQIARVIKDLAKEEAMATYYYDKKYTFEQEPPDC